MILTAVMLLAVYQNAQAMGKTGRKLETPQEKALREKKEAANAQRKALAAQGKATNPALIAAAKANPKAKTVPVHKVQLQAAAEARAKKAATPSRPASRTLTKQPTSMNVQQQSEELTAGIFDEPTKSAAARPTPPAGLANKALKNAYDKTFIQLPIGKEWARAFGSLKLATWKKAVPTFLESVKKGTDTSKVLGFNSRLVNFIELLQTPGATIASPLKLVELSDEIGTYLKQPNIDPQVRFLAQTIKNAVDYLDSRIK